MMGWSKCSHLDWKSLLGTIKRFSVVICKAFMNFVIKFETVHSFLCHKICIILAWHDKLKQKNIVSWAIYEAEKHYLSIWAVNVYWMNSHRSDFLASESAQPWTTHAVLRHSTFVNNQITSANVLSFIT
jgi:hypothetical protein